MTSIRIDYPDGLQRFDTSPSKREQGLIIEWNVINNRKVNFYIDVDDRYPTVKTLGGRILKRWLLDQQPTQSSRALFVERPPVRFTIAPGQSFTDFGVYDIPPDPVFDLFGLKINFSARGNVERFGRPTYTIHVHPEITKP